MKINCVATKIDVVSGGGSNQNLDLRLRYLAKRGHEVVLTTLYSSGNKFAEKPPYSVEELDFRNTKFLDIQNSLAELLLKKEKKFDLFYLDGVPFIWGGGIYKKKGGRRPVAVYINTYLPAMLGINLGKNSFRGLVYRVKQYLWTKLVGLRAANLVDVMFVASPIVKRIYGDFGFLEKKMLVMPDFLEVADIPKADLLPPPFQKAPGVFGILYTGRLIDIKGVDILIAAAERLISEGQAVLHIVGDGPERGQLESSVKKKGNLSGKVFFHGWKNREELFRYYAYSDLFVHPCRLPEPFGRSVVEAMSAGLPVIVPSGTGSEWIADDAGLVFKRGSMKDLRKKLLFLVQNRETYERIKNNAKRRAAHFDYSKYAPEFEAVLNRLTKGLPPLVRDSKSE